MKMASLVGILLIVVGVIGLAVGGINYTHREKVVDISRGVRSAAIEPESSGPSAPAAPSVRRMARELGVEIAEVVGTGEEGRISIEDVKAHAKRLLTMARTSPSAASTTRTAFTSTTMCGPRTRFPGSGSTTICRDSAPTARA